MIEMSFYNTADEYDRYECRNKTEAAFLLKSKIEFLKQSEKSGWIVYGEIDGEVIVLDRNQFVYLMRELMINEADAETPELRRMIQDAVTLAGRSFCR